ncbi:ribbon-helix-helix domain-containing protein [Nocardioides sp. YIM 152588]|uniref:ribbon-helix-helix domain-containing protein n=1 Tax=Nocardioides sp. YIM 152588 TaxID=3158259 RepID=UPI0032E384C0
MTVHKVAVTLPEELYQLVERARALEHRTRSEVIQEALRSHFADGVHVPRPEELPLLMAGLHEADGGDECCAWGDVRRMLRSGR